MRSAAFLVRRLALAPVLALALAACGNGGGTGVVLLTPEQVGGVYRICAMTFVPSGGFPEAVNVLEQIEPADSRLELSSTARQLNLLYRLRDGGLTQTAPGTYQLGTTSVDLSFAAGSASAALLLPTTRQLTFEFQESPRQLTSAQNPATYTVAKADYERLTGTQYPNLSNQIQGTLSARFTQGSCS